MSEYELYAKAKACVMMEDEEGALEWLLQVENGEEDDPYAAPIIARIYIERGRLEEAVPLLSKYVDEMFDDPYGEDISREEYELGCTLVKLGREDEAAPYLYGTVYDEKKYMRSVSKWREDL